ncbi:hypothetical protein MLD38_032545 [Melastoma candidum]|uniref:Uncharacterized protein n=1 Tax=Melastoma candidum TaxID=119954 RepID=A0ACB9M4J4_9MYRT|nr:hypothetical protein MLD38_032545 [Melastoma candidum]
MVCGFSSNDRDNTVYTRIEHPNETKTREEFHQLTEKAVCTATAKYNFTGVDGIIAAVLVLIWLSISSFPPANRIDSRQLFAMSLPPPPPALKAVTLTHVRYQRGDQLGHFLAWISLVPVFISLGGFVSHFLFRRELHTLLFALGLCLSHIISDTIKTAVQQSRPSTCHLLETCDSHGWPSSHSQYMFFFATYFSLVQWRRSRRINPDDVETGFRWGLCALTWFLAVLTMQSRVYLGYHTVGQVFAGMTLGILLGAIWFSLVDKVFRGYFPMIEDSLIGRMFYLKDTSHIPNVLKFEYDNARAARKGAGSKSS